ncbi:MAG: preprotein translocase subunit SecG [Dysgonamonadaceae bacterium]|jgi:preprotein translocase subunit SecG|nr:preprotein translocase subunit SecG [Dysgonamonadaceae bacterium]
MYTVIVILLIIVSIFLTLVVLVQNSKGGGLAANFAAGNQTFGVRQTADFLEKATWTLAIAILVLSLSATMFIPRGEISTRSTVPEELQRVQPGQPDFSNLPAIPVQPTSTPEEETPAQ